MVGSILTTVMSCTINKLVSQLSLVMILLLVYIAARKSKKKRSCLGPPFIYVSTHDEIQNILKYTIDGCLLSSNVLQTTPSHKFPNFIELRSMAFGTYWDGERNHSNALFIADAVSYHSAIYIFSDCQPSSNHQRTMLHTMVTTKDNPGVDHTYGLAFGRDDRLYATFQHTDVVLSFSPQNRTYISKQTWTYSPGKIPPALQQPDTVSIAFENASVVRIPMKQQGSSSNGNNVNNNRYNQPNHWYDYFPGTFYQFGKPRIQKRDAQGVRSILLLHYCDDGSVIANNDMDVVDHQLLGYNYDDVSDIQNKSIIRTMLWIANEDIDGILVIDESTGLAQHILTVHNPIHLMFHGKTQQVFASSKRKHWRGAVFAINPHSMKVIGAYSTNEMDHPTGLAIYENILYVGVQERANIIKFDLKTKKYLGVVVKNVPGEIEHLLLSPC